MFRGSVAPLVLSVLVAGCGSSPTAPSLGIPFAVTDLVVGTGDTAANGQVLTVEYTGWLYVIGAPDNKGAVFDSTDGARPFVFTLGAGQVIQGWEQGLVGMRVGGERRLVIPPELGYGEDGFANIIPPNATLLFEILLLSIQ